MTKPPKHRIRASFERAAPTYDSAATIQRRICRQLSSGLPESLRVSRLLDAGCGTGFALPLLQQRFPTAHSVALDLSAGMLRQIAAPACRLAGDLEHLPLADGSFDLYWSSLAVQWCDLGQTLAEARRVLRPRGHLALATLGPETFHELRTAFADADDYRHTLHFHGAAEAGWLAASAGLAAVDVQKGRETAWYPDFKSLLRAVKAIGANQIGSGRRPGLMSRAAFARAEAACESLRCANGLPLSYDIIYLHARA